jgi:hypothetical protein
MVEESYANLLQDISITYTERWSEESYSINLKMEELMDHI